MDRIKELEQAIVEHKKLYYAGTPKISDFEFDALEEELRSLKPDSYVLNMVGIEDFKADFVHKVPMLSNQKCLTDEELFTWLKKMYKDGYRDFSASEKMDGMSCAIHYVGGALQRAVSRGDGEKGTDITAKVSPFVPQILDIDFTGEIRGELVMSYDNFKKLNEMSPEPFTHPRNAVVGVINDDQINEERLRLIDFKVFRILNNSENDVDSPWFEEEDTIATDLAIAERLGFKTVGHKEITFTNLKDIESETFAILRDFEHEQMADYPKDGVVFRVLYNDDYEELGYTSHHPRGATAWKFKASEVVVTIKNIEWSVGTKDISPVAEFEPVMLDGARVTRASLKSVKNMVELGVMLGSRVVIRRSGGVIPAVLSAAEDSQKVTKEQILESIPQVCPVCGKQTTLSDDYAHLECSNSECSGKFSRKLEIFAKMLGMRNFGPANCLLLAERVPAFHEVFALSLQDIIDCGIGEGMAQNIYNEIRSVKVVPLKNFLACLNIPKMGPNTAQLLATTYKSLYAIRNLTVLDIVSDIDRAGEDSARILVNGIKAAENEMDALLQFIQVDDITSTNSGNAYEGMIICITGPLSVDRNVWKEKIEANGGKFSTSVSKNTTCLICNQKSSTSSKYKKALQLGTPIYTEEWLLEKLK